MGLRRAGKELFGEPLIRVFDGPSWESASYRFEDSYVVEVDMEIPRNLQLGTSPLVLLPVPESSSVLLLLVGLGALLGCRRQRSGLLVVMVVRLVSAKCDAQDSFQFNNHIGFKADARFVLPTDPARTSSVGTDCQVQLFGGPAGTALAGYVIGTGVTVPDAPHGSTAAILVRVLSDAARAWQTSAPNRKQRRVRRCYTRLAPTPFAPAR